MTMDRKWAENFARDTLSKMHGQRLLSRMVDMMMVAWGRGFDDALDAAAEIVGASGEEPSDLDTLCNCILALKGEKSGL